MSCFGEKGEREGQVGRKVQHAVVRGEIKPSWICQHKRIKDIFRQAAHDSVHSDRCCRAPLGAVVHSVGLPCLQDLLPLLNVGLGKTTGTNCLVSEPFELVDQTFRNFSAHTIKIPAPPIRFVCSTSTLSASQETKVDSAPAADVQALIDANPVLVMATSTCPFCIEVLLPYYPTVERKNRSAGHVCAERL